MGALQAADEDDADQEFWNQDFFQEEERDDEYATESEPEDRFDADFMQSVSQLGREKRPLKLAFDHECQRCRIAIAPSCLLSSLC